MKTGARIDYKQLRAINPETARYAVLEYLKTNKYNIANTAYVFGINRSVIYDILKKEKEGDLKDRSRRPKNSPKKTPKEIEDKVLKFKNQTRLGAKRLSSYLLLDEALGYLYYYNNIRNHSSLNDKTPFDYLKEKLPEINDTIRYVQPFLLDSVAVKLGPWSGYNVLAQYLVKVGYIGNTLSFLTFN